jgi:hypothetical protein
MAQIGWVFLDDFGGRHRVGLYHGDRTGHVLLHCDNRIIQVDFSVKESCTYSFFIEDELCEIQLVKEHGVFSYAFEVNKTIDTPRNRVRRIDDRRNIKYMAFLIGGFFFLIFLIFWGLKCHSQPSRYQPAAETATVSTEQQNDLNGAISREGKSASVQLFIVQEGGHRKVYYGFLTSENIRITGIYTVPDTGQILLPNGFPLTDRDIFDVRYLPARPETYTVDFANPAQTTIVGYYQRALAAERAAHPEQSLATSECRVKAILQEKGWKALSDVIYQSQAPDGILLHNRDTYRNLVADPGLADLMRAGCGAPHQ